MCVVSCFGPSLFFVFFIPKHFHCYQSSLFLFFFFLRGFTNLCQTQGFNMLKGHGGHLLHLFACIGHLVGEPHQPTLTGESSSVVGISLELVGERKTSHFSSLLASDSLVLKSLVLLICFALCTKPRPLELFHQYIYIYVSCLT